MVRYSVGFLVSVLGLALPSGCSTTVENSSFCVFNGGNEYCEANFSDTPYCSRGLPECLGNENWQQDGCVGSIPRGESSNGEECYSPCGVAGAHEGGCAQDASGGAMTTESTGDAGDTQGVMTVALDGSGEGSSGGVDRTGGSSTGNVVGDTGSSSGNSSTAGGEEATYPACPNGLGDCRQSSYEYDYCYGDSPDVPGYSMCTPACVFNSGCFSATSGSISPQCRGPFPLSRCVFDCTDNPGGCPDGMVCVDVDDYGFRCLWSD